MLYEKTFYTYDIARFCRERSGNLMTFAMHVKNSSYGDDEWVERIKSQAEDWALHAALLEEMRRNGECELKIEIEMEI